MKKTEQKKIPPKTKQPIFRYRNSYQINILSLPPSLATVCAIACCPGSAPHHPQTKRLNSLALVSP